MNCVGKCLIRVKVLIKNNHTRRLRVAYNRGGRDLAHTFLVNIINLYEMVKISFANMIKFLVLVNFN